MQPGPTHSQRAQGTRALRWESLIGSVCGAAAAGIAALGLFTLTASWLAAGAGVLIVAGLLGTWTDLRTRRNLEFIDELMTATRDAAEGRTQRARIHVDAKGPYAELGLGFNQLMASITDMASRVLSGIQGVRGAPERLSVVLSELGKSADAQEEAVEETASLLANINSSIRLVDERIEQLSGASDESSSAIMQMGSSVEEVARNAASLHEAFESYTSAIHETSASTRQVSEGANMVRRMAEESAVSMNEMDRSIQEVSEHVQQASALTATVNEGAREGAEAVRSTIQDIEHIHSLVAESKTDLAKLVSRIGEISKIMNVIDDINDETNLLSLNAAIIAAQAGEQGRAFLVVANHVKVLATRTAASTKDIEQLIYDIQTESDKAVSAMEAGMQAIDQGVQRSRQAGDALSEIRRSSDEANSTVAEIARASEQQSKSSKLVAKAVEETSHQIQQISEAMQEQTRTSERMLVTAQEALEMCQHVHRSTDEQKETGRYITGSISSITDMISGIRENIADHRRASEAVSESVFRLLDNARVGGAQVPQLNALLSELRDSAQKVVAELSRFEQGADGLQPSGPLDAPTAAPEA